MNYSRVYNLIYIEIIVEWFKLDENHFRDTTLYKIRYTGAGRSCFSSNYVFLGSLPLRDSLENVLFYKKGPTKTLCI